jgi:hypothetical protein
MSLFGNRLKYVNARVWDTTQPDFQFPELEKTEVAQRPNLGLAFSGGSTRSAAATLGQFRALQKLGILGQARYLSCVSGSSFPAAAYTYLPTDRDEATFLGTIVEPADLSPRRLAEIDARSFNQAVACTHLGLDYFLNVLRLAGDETYARVIGDNFLLPFGLDSSKRFFSYDQKTVQSILKYNPAMTAEDFYLVRPDMPFLIVSAIVLRPDNEPPQPKKIPLEITPLYTGVRPLFQGAGSRGRSIGGGYIEPFGFDGDAPEEDQLKSSRAWVRLGASRHRFTLADAIGTSGAAPAESLVESGWTFIGFPEFKYWSPTNPGEGAIEYEFGDGGNLENLSIMPLLARWVERIIVFVNTRHPLSGAKPGQINSAIPPVFGLDDEYPNNAVFPAEQYEPLVEGLLAAKRAGNAVIYKDRYPVLENPFFGIPGGWEVEVLWVYSERVPAFERELPLETGRLIGQDLFKNFPHFKTYGENPPAIIGLEPEQVNMLAHLSSWNILNNAELFLSMLA